MNIQFLNIIIFLSFTYILQRFLGTISNSFSYWMIMIVSAPSDHDQIAMA